MDKYKNRIASPPVKVSAQLTGRTAYGIEYSYSTEDGKNTIKVSHYVDDLGMPGQAGLRCITREMQ